MITVAALYHFAPLPDAEILRGKLQDLCDGNGIKGILLLAKEGINGTVAGSREGIDRLLAFLRSDDRLKELVHKESFAEKMPFFRMKVRLKKEIVTLKRPEADPNVKVGTYVDPKDWNEIISDPDVIVLDTRNDYEVKIGTFEHALNPKTENFVEFPDYVFQNLDPQKHKKIAMFCTGGIRCEKASAFMLQAGFETVYHLKGGILKYLEEIPQDQSLWKGNCFVFDQRVSVGHGLALGDEVPCYGCRRPLTPQERLSPLYKEGVHCQYCHDTMDDETKKRNTERQRQMELAEKRHQSHMGITQKRHLKPMKQAAPTPESAPSASALDG